MSDHCEIAEFYHWTEPVARKPHKCCECSAPILKGEKHFYCYGKWSYGTEAFRQHQLCMDACILIRDKMNGGDCIGFGCLMEEFEELRGYGKGHEDHRKLRSMMAKIKWREHRSKGENLGKEAKHP